MNNNLQLHKWKAAGMKGNYHDKPVISEFIIWSMFR